MRFAALIFIFLLSNLTRAQHTHTRTINISVSPIINGKNLILDKTYSFGEDSVTITKCRFYLSQITFLREGQLVFSDATPAHLFDYNRVGKTQIRISCPESISFDAIQFLVGIDSAMNVSGALDGDLDPTKGMYWTWQSGYVNVKLEGLISYTKSDNNEFEYHLGGYLTPNYAAQAVRFELENSDRIQVEVDLNPFFDSVDFRSNLKIMSPSQEAVLMSDEFANSFQLTNE